MQIIIIDFKKYIQISKIQKQRITVKS